MKDENGDIRYYKVVEHLLLRFNGESMWEWLAARMRNYMLHLVRSKDYKAKHYNPAKDKLIEGDHVCRFFGC